MSGLVKVAWGLQGLANLRLQQGWRVEEGDAAAGVPGRAGRAGVLTAVPPPAPEAAATPAPAAAASRGAVHCQLCWKIDLPLLVTCCSWRACRFVAWPATLAVLITSSTAERAAAAARGPVAPIVGE